jgi:hypothetical protein
MARYAERISYGDEVVETLDWMTPSPPMRSGKLPRNSWRQAAFQHTVLYTERLEDNGVGIWANLTDDYSWVNNKGYYGINITYAPSTSEDLASFGAKMENRTFDHIMLGQAA